MYTLHSKLGTKSGGVKRIAACDACTRESEREERE